VGDGHDRYPVGVDPVDVRELVVERTVDGGGHGESGVVLGVEGAHHGVVVDHVTVPDGLVGVDDMPDLRHRTADPGALGRGEHPLARNRTGRVAGGEEQDIVPGILQAPGQLVHDELDPPVEQGRDGSPGWGDDSDPHGEIQASRRGE